MNIDSIIDGKELFLIAGPCVVESEEICFTVAEKLKELSEKHNIPAIFKSSEVIITSCTHRSNPAST